MDGQDFYELTPAELATAQVPLQVIATQQQVLSFFLNHLVRVGGLPAIEGGYTLSPDGKRLIPAVPRSA